MAVYAAHLTRTLQGTPTVFQVTAQEALGATVKPALRKVVEYLAAVSPNRCGWCLRWYDEVYLLFDSCLQYYYLKHYAASFSESFYDLIRVPISSSSEFSSGQQLPLHLERASLALLVLVPYLTDKIEAIVERWREDDEDGRLGKTACVARRVACRRRRARRGGARGCCCWRGTRRGAARRPARRCGRCAWRCGRRRPARPPGACPAWATRGCAWCSTARSACSCCAGGRRTPRPRRRCPRRPRHSATSARPAGETSAPSAFRRGRCPPRCPCRATYSATRVSRGTCALTRRARCRACRPPSATSCGSTSTSWPGPAACRLPPATLPVSLFSTSQIQFQAQGENDISINNQRPGAFHWKQVCSQLYSYILDFLSCHPAPHFFIEFTNS